MAASFLFIDIIFLSYCRNKTIMSNLHATTAKIRGYRKNSDQVS